MLRFKTLFDMGKCNGHTPGYIESSKPKLHDALLDGEIFLLNKDAQVLSEAQRTNHRLAC